MPASATWAGTTGEEAGKEGMKLSDPVFRYVDRDLLVVGWG